MGVRYFRRPLETRAGDTGECVIYAVQELPVDERTDPVRVVGSFPDRWRPTPNPGEVLHDADARGTVWMCEVPRSQFRHYQEIPESEAFARCPALARREDRQAIAANR